MDLSLYPNPTMLPAYFLQMEKRTLSFSPLGREKVKAIKNKFQKELNQIDAIRAQWRAMADKATTIEEIEAANKWQSEQFEMLDA